MAKKQREGECAYCGEVRPLTDEHVIPQCLFTRPLPSDIVVIPVCDECNGDKSRDDDYLRDILVTDVFACEHPVAKTIFHTKMLSSARKDKSVIARAAKANAKWKPFHTSGGIYLGHAFTFPIDGVRVKKIFSKIVRGLYYKIRHKRIPENYEFEVTRWDSSLFKQVWPNLQQIGFNGPYRCGDVLVCLMLYAQEDEFLSEWWLWFYDSICIHILTKPPDFKWDLAPNSGKESESAA